MARPNSMRGRMTLGFVLVLAPFLLVTCTILVLITGRLEAVQDRQLMRRTVIYAGRVLARPDWRGGLAALMASPSVREHEIGLLVLDPLGRVVWRSSDALPSRAPVVGGAWQIVQARAGLYTLIAAQPGPAPSARRGQQRWELLALSLCVIVGVSAGAWALVGRTLSPIHKLARQAEAATSEPLVRLDAPSQDAEVVELVRTLNGLLARQAETAAVKGRFYAAASHELRTPLQALSGHLELALSRPRAAGEYAAALAEAQQQTQRLTSLVRALLLLHQLAGPRSQPQEPVDLAGVCADALASLRPRLAERALRLQANVAAPVVVQAVPTHAEMLVRNLLENAARYANSGGLVSVVLRDVDSHPRLEVFNECALPEGADPQAWFEPFRRPDAARHAQAGGNGLGLAICRAIATANGWDIQLVRAERGVLAMVTFGP